MAVKTGEHAAAAAGGTVHCQAGTHGRAAGLVALDEAVGSAGLGAGLHRLVVLHSLDAAGNVGDVLDQGWRHGGGAGDGALAVEANQRLARRAGARTLWPAGVCRHAAGLGNQNLSRPHNAVAQLRPCHHRLGGGDALVAVQRLSLCRRQCAVIKVELADGAFKALCQFEPAGVGGEGGGLEGERGRGVGFVTGSCWPTPFLEFSPFLPNPPPSPPLPISLTRHQDCPAPAPGSTGRRRARSGW